jgi:predicted ABC-type ATPase
VNTTNQRNLTTHIGAIPNSSVSREWSTFDTHFNKQQGTWLTERFEAVHQPVIDKLFAGKLPSQTEQPRCDLIGGGFGVGKSRLARQILTKRPNSILIDPDILKEFIPEYARFKREDLDTAWLRVHDESRHIAQEVLAHAISGRFDVIIDTCCSNSQTAGLIKELQSRGYFLAMEFVDVPVEVAISRIKIAAKVPGRAHYGRWAYGPESKFWQSPDSPFAPPETWDFIADLFEDRAEFDAWRRLLPLK